MSAGARVASFGALLVAIFALAALAGRALDPATEAAERADGGHHAPAPGATADGLRLVARVDGYDVRLAARGTREHPQLRFAVSRDGTPVRDLQPYLGARGHLVMLRAGDLAYEHVHPLSGDDLAFETADVAPGTYRLFLQFRHGGQLRTAAFTRTVTR